MLYTWKLINNHEFKVLYMLKIFKGHYIMTVSISMLVVSMGFCLSSFSAFSLSRMPPPPRCFPLHLWSPSPLEPYLEGAVCSPCFAEGRNSQSPDCHSCYSPEAQYVSLWPGVDIEGDRMWDRYPCLGQTLQSQPRQNKASRESLLPWVKSCFLYCACVKDHAWLSSSRWQDSRPIKHTGWARTPTFSLRYWLSKAALSITQTKK